MQAITDNAGRFAELGADPGLCDPARRQELDARGFTLLPGIVDPAWLADLRARFDALAAAEGPEGGREVHTEHGTRRLADLVNKGAVFDRLWSHPQVLAAVRHVLGDAIRLSSLNARDALPGHGHQGLHRDWDPGWTYAGRFHVCNSIWLLDDFDDDNGCTRIVPGSHRNAIATRDLADPAAPHPDEVHLHAPAGTVCVFNSHCWHGGTRNRSRDRTRRAIHCYYTTRTDPQQTDQRAHLRDETRDRLAPAQRWLLDVD